MKKNNEPPTLEELLSSVEHAGRDHRRRQQLSEMIEQLAAAEASKRRTVRLWVSRLAVAASVTLFVVIPTWWWISPSSPTGLQVAQAPVPRRTHLPLPHAGIVARPTKSVVAPAAKPATLSQSAVPQVEEPVLPIEPELVAVDPTVPFLLGEDLLAENIDYEEALPVEEETLPEAPATTTENLAQATSQPDPKPARGGFFSLLHPEPSLMEGTMLAFNLL
ncbi:MAG: hypothetical protein IJ785_00550 [Bacteroidales bacterium]|nr:hypothetical protein [Bacteroidales bacterium]